MTDIEAPTFRPRGRPPKMRIDSGDAPAQSPAATHHDLGVTITMPDGSEVALRPVSDPPIAPLAGLAAPWDGKPVFLARDSETFAIGRWRWTREYRGGRWHDIGVWSRSSPPLPRLGFEPIGWRPYRA